MNLVMREQDWDEIANTATSVEDRRIHDRLKLLKTVHITCLDPGLTEETGTVVDISREGLYLTVRSRHYQIGMELKVAIPSLGFEGVCKVVRIEELPSGCLGLGGHILGW